MNEVPGNDGDASFSMNYMFSKRDFITLRATNDMGGLLLLVDRYVEKIVGLGDTKRARKEYRYKLILDSR